MPTREMKEKYIRRSWCLFHPHVGKRYIEHTRKHFDAFQDHSPIYPLENIHYLHIEVEYFLKSKMYFYPSFNLERSPWKFSSKKSRSKPLKKKRLWKEFYTIVTKSMEEDSTILQISSRNYLFIKRALPTLLYVNTGLHRAWS